VSRILIDTGPLVAFLRESEKSHEWVAARFRELPAPYLTCEPVLAETFFLVSRHSGGVRRFFDLLDSGLLEVDFSVLRERAALRKLIHKYDDLPMSLADACLVRLAELNSGASVFTLDGHFRLYRKNGRQQIPVIMP
jgi:predicted nucleic acid-binding protein